MQPISTANHTKKQLIVKISFVIPFVMAFGLLAIFSKLQPQLPLLYTLALPAQYLVTKEYLFMIPGIALAIFFLHFIIYKKLMSSAINPVVWKLFWSITILIQLLLAISLIRIIWITI